VHEPYVVGHIWIVLPSPGTSLYFSEVENCRQYLCRLKGWLVICSNVRTPSFKFLACIMLLNMAHALNMWLGLGMVALLNGWSADRHVRRTLLDLCLGSYIFVCIIISLVIIPPLHHTRLLAHSSR
jgi:hypothetical protein